MQQSKAPLPSHKFAVENSRAQQIVLFATTTKHRFKPAVQRGFLAAHVSKIDCLLVLDLFMLLLVKVLSLSVAEIPGVLW